MLDPHYLQSIADGLEDEFAQLENDILCDIAERIKENDYSNTSTAQFQKSQLNALGLSDKEIQNKLAKILKLSEKQITHIISQSVYKTIDNDNVFIDEAVKAGILSYTFDTVFLKDIILQGIDDLSAELNNICKTTAITSRKLLTQGMNKAYLQIQSGAFTYDQAIDNVVRELAKQGLGKIEYRSGAERQLDTTVRTAVRTSVNQTSAKAQEKHLDELDINLVQATSHWGARPLHAEWQGKIFWRKDKVEGYDNFYEATGFGKGSGLCGWNCRHSYYPHFEGLSESSFDQIDSEENEEYYNKTQIQRYNERKIREWKRRRDVCKAGGIDYSKEARKVKEWNQRQKEFLKANPELKRNYAREVAYKKGYGGKLKEYYFTEDKNVKMKVNNKEASIRGNKYESSFVFDDKGNVILSKKGLEHEVEFTIDEITNMKNGILTHNHPMNTTFSPSDIYFAVDANLQEIRVSVDIGSYVLRRNENLHLLPSYENFVSEHLRLYKKYRKIYKTEYSNWQQDKKIMEIRVQDAVLNALAEKYQLNYYFQWR